MKKSCILKISLDWLTSHQAVKNCCIHFEPCFQYTCVSVKYAKNSPVGSVDVDGLTVLLLTLSGTAFFLSLIFHFIFWGGWIWGGGLQLHRQLQLGPLKVFHQFFVFPSLTFSFPFLLFLLVSLSLWITDNVLRLVVGRLVGWSVGWPQQQPPEEVLTGLL